MSEKVPLVRSTYGRGKQLFKSHARLSALSSLPPTMLQSIKDREDRIHKDLTATKANRTPLANITNRLADTTTPSCVSFVKSTIQPPKSLELDSSGNDSPILTEIEEGNLWDSDPQRMEQVFNVLNNQEEEKLNDFPSSPEPLSESTVKSSPAPLSEATIKSSPYRRQKPITPPDEISKVTKTFDIWDIEEIDSCRNGPIDNCQKGPVANVQPSQLKGKGFWMRQLKAEEIVMMIEQNNLPDHFIKN